MRKLIKMLTSKVIILGLFLLVQLVFLIFLFNALINDEMIGIYLHFFFLALSILIVLHIISSNINPEYKIAWLIPILAFPVFYIFYHQNNVRPKVRNKFRQIKAKRKFLLNKIPNSLDYKEINYLNNNGWRYYRNTVTKFLPSGEEKLKSLLIDLENAEKFILLEYYILAQGYMFDQIMEILERKAKDGLEVKIIYDDMGSADRLPFNFVKKLKLKGIEARPFNRMSLHLNFAMNYRTHRKIVIIDNKVAYTGGINIGDEYINRDSKLGHWQDSAIRIEGEAVWSLTLTYLENWNFSNKKDTIEYEPYQITHSVESNEVVAPFADNPIEDKQIARAMFLYLIGEAKDEILITSPYLILDNELQTALMLASKAGVKIKIVIPNIPDKRSVYLVTESYALTLLDMGIEIYKYNPGFIHSKLFVVDNKKAIIGTSNLDFRSLYLNFENNIYLYNSKEISNITNYINDSISQSTLMKKEDLEKNSFIVKTIQNIARGFSALL